MNEDECLDGMKSPRRAYQPSSIGNNHVYYASRKDKHGRNDDEERNDEEERNDDEKRHNDDVNRKCDLKKIKLCTIDLTPRNTVLGTLKNHRQIIVLIDSGATLSIVGQSFIDNNPNVIIGQIKTLKDPITICIADASKIPVDRRITFEVQLGQVTIMINALPTA